MPAFPRLRKRRVLPNPTSSGGKDSFGALDNFVKNAYNGARFSAKNPGWSGIINANLELVEQKAGIKFNGSSKPILPTDAQIGAARTGLEESNKRTEFAKELYTDILVKAAKNDTKLTEYFNKGRIEVGAQSLEQFRSHVIDYAGAMIGQHAARAQITNEHIGQRRQAEAAIQALEYSSEVVALI